MIIVKDVDVQCRWYANTTDIHYFLQMIGQRTVEDHISLRIALDPLDLEVQQVVRASISSII